MFLVKYHSRIMIDGFTCRDVSRSFKCHKIDIMGGIAYCYRSRYAYVTISEDELDSIDDLDNPGAYIDIPASFKAGELAYCLPF